MGWQIKCIFISSKTKHLLQHPSKHPAIFFYLIILSIPSSPISLNSSSVKTTKVFDHFSMVILKIQRELNTKLKKKIKNEIN